MSNRIFYGCLGIAPCGGTPIEGVQSVSLSANRSVSTIFTPGKKTYSGKYSNLPDIELSYTKYVDSLTSFSYNVGNNAFANSTLLRKLNQGASKQEVALEFAKWNKVTINGEKVVSNGLVRRRKLEADLFLS